MQTNSSPRHRHKIVVFNWKRICISLLVPIWETSEIFELEQQKQQQQKKFSHFNSTFIAVSQMYAKYSNQLSASTPRNKNTQTYWSCMMDQVLFTEEFTQQPRRKTTHSSAGDVVFCCVESCQIKTQLFYQGGCRDESGCQRVCYICFLVVVCVNYQQMIPACFVPIFAFIERE